MPCRPCRKAKCDSTTMLDGKTVVITGGNAGIGKETAIDLAKRGARVIIGCRDLSRGNAAVREIQESSGNQEVFVELLDLASLASVRKFAEKIEKNEPRLDILINNAGVMMCPFRRTEDGFEMQFGINHLGHFLLTNLLLELIKRSAPSRIVTVSSGAHSVAPAIDFENWNAEEYYSRMRNYSNSKLANILFTRELSKRLAGSGVTTYALHPGVVSTDLGRHICCYSCLKPIIGLCFKTARQGAQTSVFCAVADEVEDQSGLYYADCAVKQPTQAAQDDAAAKRLWDLSAELVKLS